MFVDEACNPTVVVAEPDTGIADAARRMREYHVGCVVVVEREGGTMRPVGIVTDRDLVVEVLAQQVQMEALTLADLMAQPLITAEENEDLLDALDRMREAGVRRAPVVDASGRLRGILAVDDVLELLVDALGHIPRLMHRERDAELQRRP
ncbi:CBS domain-containing protein [Solimonas aquatica]|uniref:CBS domain-containing protein n=1 Tax=Solimonas aquatica TaxID=489703 RepID=A0A1H9LWD8_9GAMM|nr:CBS domain-containing protein [Solimonas aquatica]SER15515.1 CBS domain-containing protein [Solimonas aquatica]